MRTKPVARHLSPPRVLAFSILTLILGGGVLLWLPISSAPGHSTTFLDALFTATSAVCVTGLIIVDTAEQFSTFGLTVLMLLIQAGGLGYMTISTVIAVALGRAISIQERLTLQEAVARIRELDRETIGAPEDELLIRYPGNTAEERYCRKVIATVRGLLDVPDDRLEEIVARLEAELPEGAGEVSGSE